MVINSIRMDLDQNNLLYNINYLEKAKNKQVLPVVKANAYIWKRLKIKRFFQ